MSWSSKNVMPFMAFEELPVDRDIYLVLNERRYDAFTKEFKAEEWQLLEDLGKSRVYYRPAQ